VKGSVYLKATPVVDAAVYMPEFPVPVLWWRSVRRDPHGDGDGTHDRPAGRKAARTRSTIAAPCNGKVGDDARGIWRS